MNIVTTNPVTLTVDGATFYSVEDLSTSLPYSDLAELAALWRSAELREFGAVRELVDFVKEETGAAVLATAGVCAEFGCELFTYEKGHFTGTPSRTCVECGKVEVYFEDETDDDAAGVSPAPAIARDIEFIRAEVDGSQPLYRFNALTHDELVREFNLLEPEAEPVLEALGEAYDAAEIGGRVEAEALQRFLDSFDGNPYTPRLLVLVDGLGPEEWAEHLI